MLGYVHSIESMGLVDGPGVRSVVFLQGCLLRCKYCHNPDMHPLKTGGVMTADELVERLCRFKTYYKGGGGVTFSGGEPLLQPEFLLEALNKCRHAGIHTCIDTAGCGLGGYDEILKSCGLVLLDIKHFTKEGYERITGRGMDEFDRFLAAAQRVGVPLWLRHVVVPGLTDSSEHMRGLISFIGKIKNVERVELLPYHTLGVHKYACLGLDYELKQTPPADERQVEKWQREIDEIFNGRDKNEH